MQVKTTLLQKGFLQYRSINNLYKGTDENLSIRVSW